jgi:hypothetical protein
MFRIVWANDETEKRMVGSWTWSSFYPVVRDIKKHSYLKDLYVLERPVVPL